jgi:hypothetical protein
MKKTIGALIALCAGLGAAVSVARPASTDGSLQANVGPGYTISLTRDGAKVTHLDPGTYTITVTDQADVHDFHLYGPGVDQATTVDGTGTSTWTVTFTDGTYTYVCDAHPTTMKGSFTVGSVPATTTTTTTRLPALTVRARATASGRIVTVHATASRRASLDFALLRGSSRVAHLTRSGATVTARLRAPGAGRYTARVIARAGTLSTRATRPVTVR